MARAALRVGQRREDLDVGLRLGDPVLPCDPEVEQPDDAAARYSREPDFGEWKDRLHVHGLDLRHSPSVELFARFVANESYDRLDLLINNACQTVRRPPDFYQHMMARGNASLNEMPENARKLLGAYEGLRGYHILPEGDGKTGLIGQKISEVAGLTHAAALSQVPLLPEELAAQKALFPEGKLDQDLQQVDLRERNSWRLRLHEVDVSTNSTC